MIVLEGVCRRCKWSYCWQSQPLIGSVPAGNLCLSAGILYSGSTPTKFLRALRFMGMLVHDVRTYFRHQSEYLIPAVIRMWRMVQPALISSIEAPVHIGVDGRCDSPGNCYFLFLNKW